MAAIPEPLHLVLPQAGVLLAIFLLLAGALVLGALGWAWLTRPAPFPYEASAPLLSEAENRFFEVLYEAIGAEFALFSKVRLADVIQVEAQLKGARRQSAFNRIKSKHADFVACDPATYAVLCVIELDDRSHREHSRRLRDEFVDGALSAAGVPILHVPVRQTYSAEELRDAIHALVG